MGFPNSNVDVDAVLSKLTLEEKVSLLAATDWWKTPAIKREEVFVPHIKVSQVSPKMMVSLRVLLTVIKTTDGPNGARGESYVSGIRAACFPCSSCLGATFDPEILYDVGKAIAEEAFSKSANVLLAPTLNVVRSPLGMSYEHTFHVF